MAAIYKHHPKRAKDCVFCKFWMGDARMKFISSGIGFEFDGNAKGPCAKRNGASTTAFYTCPNYAPGLEAEKLL